LGNAFFGPNIEPVNGVDFYAGVSSAHQTALPGSLPLTSVLQPVSGTNGPPTIPTVTNLRWGFTFGLGFDVNTFLAIFKPSVASLP
jgi:hypothetical protein